MTRRVGLLLVVCCAATLLGVRAVSVSEDEFPTAYSLPMMSEPVVSASTPPGAAPVPMSLAEEQNAMAAAEAAERRRLTAQQFAQTVQERLQPHTSASHPRVVLGAGKRSYSAGFTAPADPLASIFGSPMRPRAPAPPAPSASRPRGVPPKMAAAPTPAPATSLLETRAHAQTAEDDEEEGGGELSGSRQVELGGDMTNAYNLYEQRVPVEPTPLSPSPFVEHPAPKQNLYPYEHTRAQLTVSPDTGTLEPNAGDGVQATTMPYQYRPYIKNEKLHRGVDPLVYRSMYTWTPNDSAGPGDVSVQDAIKEPRDMFKPRDWSVKITQPAANIEIARRGQDNYGADHRSQIAVPTMPPEFYQFSAPTPPMFHAPLPPVPRKAHRDAAPRAPDIFPAFIEEATSVTAAEQQQVVSESAASEEQRDAGAYDINLPPGSKFKPFPLVRPHIHPTGSIRRYRIASDPLQELLNDPYWDALERENDQALSRHRVAAPSAVAQVKDLKRKRAEVVAPKPVQPQPQVTPVVSKPAVTQPAAPKVSLPTVAAPVPQSHDAMVREFERLANRHSAIVSVRDAADAAAGQRWHALNRKHQRQPLTRYEELQAAHDRLPHERYHELHRRLARHPYERYDALHEEYQSQFGGGGGSTATAPYERYGQLHQQLYGVPPPPPQGLAQEQPRFQQTEVADSVEEVEGVEDAEAEAAQDGFSTGAPADSFFAPDQFDAETGVQYDRETAAVQTPQQTEGDFEAHQHLALFYPSIRAAAGVQA